jgi:hypothetical protein
MQDMLAHVERLGVNVIFDHIEKAALTAGSLQLAMAAITTPAMPW